MGKSIMSKLTVRPLPKHIRYILWKNFSGEYSTEVNPNDFPRFQPGSRNKVVK